jgi:hypothetical protein
MASHLQQQASLRENEACQGWLYRFPEKIIPSFIVNPSVAYFDDADLCCYGKGARTFQEKDECLNLDTYWKVIKL